MSGIYEQMLQHYNATTSIEQQNAVYEVVQQIALAGLYKGGFFDKAAFYGGTCLRLFHNTFFRRYGFFATKSRRKF